MECNAVLAVNNYRAEFKRAARVSTTRVRSGQCVEVKSHFEKPCFEVVRYGIRFVPVAVEAIYSI